ncbi:hypothetical protein GWI33_012080 [Rhynchophorus ferrugineus]|uniref:Uncharacterized protein n=1 Tax=Rhynchophorus ferrugineus TaxID=354439 RepID=A0A834IA19_RHYFE|nr:hypothetical protein GWI33_012080 [Rhynchophorus ferrugineus]
MTGRKSVGFRVLGAPRVKALPRAECVRRFPGRVGTGGIDDDDKGQRGSDAARFFDDTLKETDPDRGDNPFGDDGKDINLKKLLNVPDSDGKKLKRRFSE